MTEHVESTDEKRPLLTVALIIFAVLVGVEWVWGRWAAPLFPPNIEGVLLVTLTARVLDGLFILAVTRTVFLGWRQMGFPEQSWKRGVRTGLAWCLILGAIAVAGLFIFRLVSGEFPALFPVGSVWFRFPWPGVGYVLVAVILSPIMEELVFRGLLYNAIRRKFSVPVAVLLATVPFAVAHGISPARVAPAVAGGILCALSFEHSRNLWTPIILHVSANGFLWIYGFWYARTWV